MKILVVISIVVVIGLFIYCIFRMKYYDKRVDKYNKQIEQLQDTVNKLDSKKDILNKEIETISNDITSEKDTYYNTINLRDNLIQNCNQLQDKLTKLQYSYDAFKDDFEDELNSYKNKRLEENQNEIDKIYKERLSQMEEQYSNLKEEEKSKYNLFLTQLNTEKEKVSNEISVIKDDLNDYQEKRRVINEQIFKERELKEQETFYKINLTQDEIDDIIFIEEQMKKLHNSDAIGRIIYDIYYKKPLSELIKRVLQNRELSGIYKITSIRTNEIYIGKSVNVSKRWTEHVKTSLGIGTLASSTLHARLKEDGVWNFTFELLEEVPKEKLNERESYWIDFYDSKNYGLNMKRGNSA